MSKFDNPIEMERVYSACKDVYSRSSTKNEAIAKLRGKTSASDSSLALYFDIYSKMREGMIYKRGTSEAFTRYLIEKIYEDEGESEAIKALLAAKKQSEYRKSVDNEQPGIEYVCKEIIKNYNIPITYQDLDDYNYETKPNNGSTRKKTNNKKSNNNPQLRITMDYGKLHAEFEGDEKSVTKEVDAFFLKILPNININNGKKKTTKKGSSTSKKVKSKSKDNVEKKLIENHPNIIDLKNRFDFKAKMIPIMYLLTYDNLKEEFTVNEIQRIMTYVLNQDISNKDINKVLSTKSDWFCVIPGSPKKYKLLDIGMDYARNILEM